MLVVGDSVALTLGLALGIDAGRYRVLEDVKGLLGCGVAIQQAVRSQGQLETMVSACNSASPPSKQWPALWTRWVRRFRPQVVVVLAGRWETQDVEIGGRWTSILHPGYAQYVRRSLARAVRIASEQGAHVDLLTSPCFDGGEQPDGRPWPESNPARVETYNRLLRLVAAEHRTTTSLVDLDALVCPGNHFREYADGVQIRDSDGIHLPGGYSGIYHFGKWVGPRLWPELLAGATPRSRRP